jgi:hypothetical protein
VTVFTGTITNDLVVHLPFDSNATDTSGHNNSGSPESQTLADGTDAGLPAYAGGGAQRVGSGALHIKDGQAINLGQPADLSFGPDVNFSVSFWVKAADANAWTGDPSFFSNKNRDSGSSQGYVLAAQGNGAWKWNWRAADGPRRDVGFPSIADNTWHNIVVSHDRQGNAAFYVDGVLKGTQTIAGDGDIDSFGLSTYIGQDGTGGYGFANDTGAHFKDIWIDDFGIWRRALTPQEAASIYAQGLKGQDLTTAAETASTGGTSPRIAIAQGSGNLTISVAGTGTFQLQKKASLNDATWTPVGAPSNSGTFTVAADGTAGFFRVLQQ